jgi:hypothetical protein
MASTQLWTGVEAKEQGAHPDSRKITWWLSRSHERPHTKEKSMESQKRTELVDALLEEARQMITVLLKASTAPDMPREMSQGTVQGTPNPQEQDTIQEERRWWEEVLKNLTEARKALGQIEQSERHRGVGA